MLLKLVFYRVVSRCTVNRRHPGYLNSGDHTAATRMIAVGLRVQIAVRKSPICACSCADLSPTGLFPILVQGAGSAEEQQPV
jgi:hypothetical protein